MRFQTTKITGIFSGVLETYAIILFSRSRTVGLVVLLATMLPVVFNVQNVSPLSGPVTLLMVVLSILLARLLGFAQENIKLGIYTYNSLLWSLACFTLLPSDNLQYLSIVGGALMLVMLSAAWMHLMNCAGSLPLLSVPFVLSLLFLQAIMQPSGHEVTPGGTMVPVGFVVIESLGSIFYQQTLLSGATIFIAMLIASRYGSLLYCFGGCIAVLTVSIIGISSPEALHTVCFNAGLTAFAIGGVFFIPSRHSFVLGVVGSIVSGVIAVLLQQHYHQLGILPFNMVTLMILAGCRARRVEALPRIIWGPSGSPEENLRNEQIGQSNRDGGPRGNFALPFHGTWTCTQGWDGPYTHQGPWRYGLDFEVNDFDGRLYRNNGLIPEDYHCYGLDVIAPADATVVHLVDGVPDNLIGEVNLDANWGNLVVLQHDEGLFTLLCHLSPGSIQVELGQYVRQGQTIGACGNSGRSPRPHLHMQWQSGCDVGSPTIEGAYNNIVTVGDDKRLVVQSCVPTEGQLVQNLAKHPGMQDLLIKPGQIRRGTFQIDDGIPISLVLKSEVSVHGEIVLYDAESSNRQRQSMIIRADHRSLTGIDRGATIDSPVGVLRVAMGRILFEQSRDLFWQGDIPKYLLENRAQQYIIQCVEPLLPPRMIRMQYRWLKCGSHFVLQGQSEETSSERKWWLSNPLRIRCGPPGIQTRTVIMPDRTIVIDLRTPRHRYSMKINADELDSSQRKTRLESQSTNRDMDSGRKPSHENLQGVPG